MNITCCVCKRIISELDYYDRIDRDFYCGYCSGFRLITCPICETCIDPDVDTEFQAPDGTLFCSQECLDILQSICTDCGNVFLSTDGSNICPACLLNYGGA